MEVQYKSAHPDNYRKWRTEPVEYIVVHYTGNRGDTARNNAAYFARERVGTSAHYFVDESEVWCSVPESSIAWHCGTAGKYYHPKCRNSNSIGVEICMLDKQSNIRQGSIDRAVLLVQELMVKYDISVGNVLRHYDVTHKCCPEPMITEPEQWEAFQNALRAVPEARKENGNVKYFETLSEIPKGELRDTVQLLIDRKAIAGNGSGLHLSEDMVRMMVYNRRMGLYQ